jgi:hypothetical protein
MPDHTFSDQLLQGAGDVFDRHFRIDAVLIEEVDAVCPEALQASLRNRLDVLGPAIGAATAFAGLEIDVETELGHDHYPIANEPRFAETPPARIVPALADEGIYIASESSFHRVLHAHGQMNRKVRAQPPRTSRPPTTHIATRPGDVWCWDVTVLPAQIQGCWFYLYLILDLYSRKIVGFEVHDTTVPSTRLIRPGERRWPRTCMPSRYGRCCTATTAQP